MAGDDFDVTVSCTDGSPFTLDGFDYELVSDGTTRLFLAAELADSSVPVVDHEATTGGWVSVTPFQSVEMLSLRIHAGTSLDGHVVRVDNIALTRVPAPASAMVLWGWGSGRGAASALIRLVQATSDTPRARLRAPVHHGRGAR